jgi:hypothetical protein
MAVYCSPVRQAAMEQMQAKYCIAITAGKKANRGIDTANSELERALLQLAVLNMQCLGYARQSGS